MMTRCITLLTFSCIITLIQTGRAADSSNKDSTEPANKPTRKVKNPVDRKCDHCKQMLPKSEFSQKQWRLAVMHCKKPSKCKPCTQNGGMSCVKDEVDTNVVIPACHVSAPAPAPLTCNSQHDINSVGSPKSQELETKYENAEQEQAVLAQLKAIQDDQNLHYLRYCFDEEMDFYLDRLNPILNNWAIYKWNVFRAKLRNFYLQIHPIAFILENPCELRSQADNIHRFYKYCERLLMECEERASEERVIINKALSCLAFQARLYCAVVYRRMDHEAGQAHRDIAARGHCKRILSLSQLSKYYRAELVDAFDRGQWNLLRPSQGMMKLDDVVQHWQNVNETQAAVDSVKPIWPAWY